MKLYKYDYTGAIGDNVVNVPTDSQFLIGIGSAATSTVKLYDGDTEIPAEPARVNAYTCFRFDTGPNPSRKRYKAVISGVDEAPWSKSFDLLVWSRKQSVAYRDAEGITADEAVEAAKDSGEFLVKDAEVGGFYTEEFIETANGVILSGPGPDFETCLELDADAENARVNAYGTINGVDLSIITPTFTDGFKDGDFRLYEPVTAVIKINGVDTTVKLFAYIPY